MRDLYKHYIFSKIINDYNYCIVLTISLSVFLILFKLLSK